jgi:hypothetical protein
MGDIDSDNLGGFQYVSIELPFKSLEVVPVS